MVLLLQMPLMIDTGGDDTHAVDALHMCNGLGPSPLNTSRLGSDRGKYKLSFARACASNWVGIGVCLPPMLSIARCSLNKPPRGTS